MAGRGATLKEIGVACGVTPSTVSAILRGKRANVRYSEETRTRVLATAKRLHYQPNRLAQSLVSGAPPIAAVALHAIRLMPFSFYSYDNLRQAALSLHEHDYEMAFVPFEDADEQLARLRRLVDGRLVGGIITNFIAEDCDRVIEYLADSGVPTILLGRPPVPGLPSVYVDRAPMYRLVAARGRAAGFARVLVAEERSESPALCFEVDGEPVTAEPVDIADPAALFVANGGAVTDRLLAEHGVPATRIWTLEDARLSCRHRPLIHVGSLQSRRMDLAVHLLMNWMTDRGQPPLAPIPVPATEDDLEWND